MSSRIGMQPVSASDVPSKAGGEIPRPLEKDEIMHIVKKYVRLQSVPRSVDLRRRDPCRTFLLNQPVPLSYHQQENR